MAMKSKLNKQTAKPEKNVANINTLVPSEVMHLISAPTLAALNVPVRNRHWGNLILSNQIGMIYGPRGKGKTWFSVAMAISMSTGTSFLDNEPKNPRKVIYLDGEMDLATIKERLVLTAASLGTALSEKLRIFTPESFGGLLPSITSADGQREIDQLIGVDWKVLFIDNYSCWSGDGRETAECWAPLMRWMLTHKRAGRTVIVIHHTGKNGEQRGSSRHEDALDWSIALQPPKESQSDGALRFTLTWKKARHLATDKAIPITACMKNAEDGVLHWGHADGVESDQRIAQAVALKAKGWTNAKIAEKFGVDRSTVGRWLKE